jgi:hypothetical protein
MDETPSPIVPDKQPLASNPDRIRVTESKRSRNHG